MKTWRSIFIVAVSLFLSACLSIDEDLSDCGSNYRLRYNVTLRTNLVTQLKTVLRERFENDVADLLEDSLKHIFREYAHDVDLSFYTNGDRRFHDNHIMDAGQATYNLTLPMNNYRHLALANLVDEEEVDLATPQKASTSYLSQIVGDTIRGHNTGLFSAREDMEVLEDQDQDFYVSLYMVNCASILVVRTDKVNYRDMQVYSSDFADGFFVNDSVYSHKTNPIIHDFRVTEPPVEREVYYAVTFPSCDTAEEAQALPTRADDGQTGADDTERIWRKYIYVTLPDGSVTRTILNVRQPLEAGQVMIIYAFLRDDGSVYSPNVEIGTSVTLKWKDGLVIET